MLMVLYLEPSACFSSNQRNRGPTTILPVNCKNVLTKSLTIPPSLFKRRKQKVVFKGFSFYNEKFDVSFKFLKKSLRSRIVKLKHVNEKESKNRTNKYRRVKPDLGPAHGHSRHHNRAQPMRAC